MFRSKFTCAQCGNTDFPLVLLQTEVWIECPNHDEKGIAYVFRQVLINKVFAIRDYMKARCASCGHQDFLKRFRD